MTKPGYSKQNRSELAQARIMALLEVGPMSAHDLAEKLPMARSNAYKHLNELMARPNRRVRIADIQLSAGRPRLVYSLGSAPDINIKIIQRKRVLAGIREIGEPATARLICAYIDMKYGLMKVYLKELRAARKIYIAAWTWSNITATPMYKVGSLPDVERPRVMPRNAPRKSRSPATIFSSLGL